MSTPVSTLCGHLEAMLPSSWSTLRPPYGHLTANLRPTCGHLTAILRPSVFGPGASALNICVLISAQNVYKLLRIPLSDSPQGSSNWQNIGTSPSFSMLAGSSTLPKSLFVIKSNQIYDSSRLMSAQNLAKIIRIPLSDKYGEQE